MENRDDSAMIQLEKNYSVIAKLPRSKLKSSSEFFSLSLISNNSLVFRKRVQFQANKPFEFKNEELVQFFGYA
jgi:hypothetical protein